MRKKSILAEKYCSECGKMLFPTPQWAYKIAGKFYCSYKCYRKAGGDNGKYKTNGTNKYL